MGGFDETDAEVCELEAISRTLAAPHGNPLDVLEPTELASIKGVVKGLA